MNEPAALGLFVAFLGGLLSFLSPCVLPLVPVLCGISYRDDPAGSRPAPPVALIHALLFVCGFSLVFILLGASATALGRTLNYYQVWVQRIGGALIIGSGLICLGVYPESAVEPGASAFTWSASRWDTSDQLWSGWCLRPGGPPASARSRRHPGSRGDLRDVTRACCSWRFTRRAWRYRSCLRPWQPSRFSRWFQRFRRSSRG